MIRVIVYSGSSIKQNEKELYNVEIVPLKIILGDNEYQDGIDITDEIFWDYLINKKKSPKTSLPSMTELEEKVNVFLNGGDEVIIVTISSGISGTYNAFRMMYEDNPKVRVIDSLSCVGGIKIIVNELENCDENYPIVPSYTYQTNNLEVLKSKTQKKHLDILTEFDHLDYAVASHWGPNAFGYIFVEKE